MVDYELIQFASECLEWATGEDPDYVLERLGLDLDTYHQIRAEHGSNGAIGVMIGLAIGKGLVSNVPEDPAVRRELVSSTFADPITGDSLAVA